MYSRKPAVHLGERERDGAREYWVKQYNSGAAGGGEGKVKRGGEREKSAAVQP